MPLIIIEQNQNLQKFTSNMLVFILTKNLEKHETKNKGV